MAKPPKKKPKIPAPNIPPPGAKLDLNQLATRIVAEATGQAPKTPDPNAGKDPKAVARGRKGGLKGGASRASSLSPLDRKKIARKAARARWKGTPGAK